MEAGTPRPRRRVVNSRECPHRGSGRGRQPRTPSTRWTTGAHRSAKRVQDGDVRYFSANRSEVGRHLGQIGGAHDPFFDGPWTASWRVARIAAATGRTHLVGDSEVVEVSPGEKRRVRLPVIAAVRNWVLPVAGVVEQERPANNVGVDGYPVGDARAARISLAATSARRA